MIPELLREIVAKGESLNVEFKGEEKAALSDSALVEVVICLANRSGEEPGWLLVGVEDDGRITGARPRHSGEKTDTYRISALIANRTRPSLACRVEIVEILTSRIGQAHKTIDLDATLSILANNLK